MKNETFKPGDVVTWRAGGTWSKHTVWGEVTRVTAAGTVFAKDEQGAVHTFRRGKYSYPIEKPSAHEIAHRAWSHSEPKTKFAWVARGLGNRGEVSGVRMHDVVKTSANVRATAKELLAIADWLDAEPQS